MDPHDPLIWSSRTITNQHHHNHHLQPEMQKAVWIAHMRICVFLHLTQYFKYENTTCLTQSLMVKFASVKVIMELIWPGFHIRWLTLTQVVNGVPLMVTILIIVSSTHSSALCNGHIAKTQSWQHSAHSSCSYSRAHAHRPKNTTVFYICNFLHLCDFNLGSSGSLYPLLSTWNGWRSMLYAWDT